MDSQKKAHDLSATLRRLRKVANLTLEVAARRADVTRDIFPKLSSGTSVPSIAVVGRLAETYGVELSDVFLPPGKKGPFSLVRANERTPMNRNSTEYGYVYEVASLNNANPRSEIFFLTLPCIDHTLLPKLGIREKKFCSCWKERYASTLQARYHSRTWRLHSVRSLI